MKPEQIQDALYLIDDEFIEKVDKVRRTKKRKHRFFMRGIAIAACFCLTVTAVFFGFNSSTVNAEDLMEGITPNAVDMVDLEPSNAKVSDFAVRLLQASAKDGQNTLISPLSVLCALAMTTNGADGETKAEMEAVLGMSAGELNGYMYTYLNSLSENEKYKLSVANSIWFKDDDYFAADKAFLQINADYYGASIYKAQFDKSTLKDINNWVDKETDGMIPEILDDIPDEAVMYLINALAFEAEWKDMYNEYQVSDGEFTLEDGSVQNVEYMYNEENLYIETENATGFIKHYSGKKYAFAALLPNEGTTVAQLVASLNGETLNDILSNPKYCTVKTKIPKFESEYKTELCDVLMSMGMEKAFDGDLADFSKLGTSTRENIYISRVLHKTFISVGEKGTKAGAVTVVEMTETERLEDTADPQTVYLYRPFVYMIIDCETNTPFFIGTMMNVNR